MNEVYFVSYRCGEVFGNCELIRREGGFSVKESAAKIEDENGFANGSVIILSFKRFEQGEFY